MARANGKGLKKLPHNFHIMCKPKVGIVGLLDNDQNTILFGSEKYLVLEGKQRLSGGCVMQCKPSDI
jgi:hypothetical protein